jgi:hypothetical protein
MGYFCERPHGLKTAEDRRCLCGAQLRLKHKMMDPRHGLTVRVFECECGERTWTEDME